MADKYKTFADLASNENEYTIELRKEDTDFLILGIHGGSIEGGTSELCRDLGRIKGRSYYLFEARKRTNNQDLHLTSTHYDEPMCTALVPQMDKVISIHGCKGDEPFTLIGGSDREAAELLKSIFDKYGIESRILNEGDRLSGSSPDNIANKSKSGRSVQLEMSTGQRKSMFGTYTREGREGSKNEEFYKYSKALNEFIDNYN